MNAICRILPSGSLVLTLGEEEREALREAREHQPEAAILSQLLEDTACNGSFAYFDAADGNPFVGLTSAPCIAEALDVDEDGTKVIRGRFWYYALYMTKDPLQELQDTGSVIFLQG